MSIAGVVLAAGASTRLQMPKQLITDAHGETLVHRAARQLVEAGCVPVFVVVGASHTDIANAVSDLSATIVMNSEWEEGIASSIRHAVHAARAHQLETGILADSGTSIREQQHVTAIDALLLSTCDMPTVGVGHLRALCAAYDAGAIRVASRYKTPEGTETVGIPAIVGAAEWHFLESLHGDRGAKQLFTADATATVNLPGGSFDIDQPRDLQTWKNA